MSNLWAVEVRNFLRISEPFIFVCEEGLIKLHNGKEAALIEAAKTYGEGYLYTPVNMPNVHARDWSTVNTK